MSLNRRPELASELRAKDSVLLIPRTTDLQRQRGGPPPYTPELLAVAEAAAVDVLLAVVVEQLLVVASVVQSLSSLRRGDLPWLRTTTNKG